jgi:hypothetical protein
LAILAKISTAFENAVSKCLHFLSLAATENGGASGAALSCCACWSGADHPGLPVNGCERSPFTLHRRKREYISVSLY